MFSTRSGYQQAFNSWLRQGPPGVLAVIDMDKVSRDPAQPVPVKNQMYYGFRDEVHPDTPALYEAMAQEFTAGVIGL